MSIRNDFKRMIRASGYEVRRVDVQASIDLLTATMLKELSVSTVLDVGANIGQFGLLLRHEGYRGRIISFEPVPGLYQTLEKTSRHDRRWQVLQTALGQSDAEMTMSLPEGPTLGSFLKPRASAVEQWNFMSGTRSCVTVPVRRLDALLPEIEQVETLGPIFLKTDTQGWDIEVVKGAEGILDRVVMLQAELSFKPLYEHQPHYTDSLSLFEGLGFDVVGLYPLVRDANWGLIEADVVMVRRSMSYATPG